MDDDDDEEYSRRINANEFMSLTATAADPSHRLTMRRNLLRSIPNLRSSPYQSTFRRRRERSRRISPTMNNLISNLEDHNNDDNHHLQMNVTTSTNHQGHRERIDEHFLMSSDEENNHEDVQVLLDLSQSTHSQQGLLTIERNPTKICLSFLKILPIDLIIHYQRLMMIMMSIFITILQQQWNQLFLRIIQLI